MAQLRKTLTRLQLIISRQYPQRRGAGYVPSIQATPKEAPSVAWAAILTPAKLAREFHLIGTPAKWFGLLALYHPDVWEIWEERVLHWMPHPHPLHGHPRAAGLPLPAFKGTLHVAERMGRLNQHPRIPDRSDPNNPKWVPWPYIGDLLLFLSDAKGPYCVNWPLKDTRKAFRRPGPKPRAKPRPDIDDSNAIARNELEIIYYQDAGIRTEQLSREDINPAVGHNLYDLFLAHRKATDVIAEARREAVQHFVDAVGTGIPAYRVLKHVEGKLGVSKEHAIALLKQAIWRRDVRVDLFKPVLMDRPLAAETVDVLDTYAAWFAR